MKQSNMVYWGMALIGLGVIFLIGTLFNLSLFKLLWPVGLIILGFWLLLPKNHQGVETATNGFISEIKRDGPWQVKNESYNAFICDLKLDMTQADIPEGETVFYISGFIGDVKMRLPEDVGVKVSTSAIIGETKVLGEKRSGFLSPLTLQSVDYKSAERRVRIEASHFISDIKVWAGESSFQKATNKVKASL